MSEVGSVTEAVYPLKNATSHDVTKDIEHKERARPEAQKKVSSAELSKAISDAESVIDSVVTIPKSISFRVDQDVSRLVVTVTEVGSDEIIRQFPPEEFMTVAKFIAAQNPDEISEDFLKGILFDTYS